ncbi:hypothetical protein [Neisseria gonorrhoeae]|uniref:hypothetical protein n=1 Tax=Neisseria gonorrhoeae TaxID=485 RepID=UPI001923DF4D|nr:hypothetical protein [Neisseria gonorrhoeae]
MPSEPSDGIFNRPPFTGAGRAWKYPNRHSRQYRNLETRPTTPQSRNPSFPRRRESGPVRTETYRIKRLPKPRVLDSHFRGNDGSVATAR